MRAHAVSEFGVGLACAGRVPGACGVGLCTIGT